MRDPFDNPHPRPDQTDLMPYCYHPGGLLAKKQPRRNKNHNRYLSSGLADGKFGRRRHKRGPHVTEFEQQLKDLARKGIGDQIGKAI
jgi:hypothetical protein